MAVRILNRKWRGAALGLALVAGAAGCTDERPKAGEIALNSRFVVDFDVIDQFGEPATDERFDGKPMLIYFGFTTCPEVCPAALGAMTATLDRLGKDAQKVQPLFVTVDWERDDASRLRDHLAYDPRILGLTGSEEALAAMRKGLNVYAAKVALPDSALGYTMDHQRLFYITDAAGTPVVAISDQVPPEQIAQILQRQL